MKRRHSLKLRSTCKINQSNPIILKVEESSCLGGIPKDSEITYTLSGQVLEKTCSFCVRPEGSKQCNFPLSLQEISSAAQWSSQQKVASSLLSTPCVVIPASVAEKPFTYSFCSPNALTQESQMQIESLQIRSQKASQHPYRLEFISSHTVMLGRAFQKVNSVSLAFLSGREATFPRKVIWLDITYFLFILT